MLTRTPGRIIITSRGVAAVVALLGVLVVPYLLARSVEPPEAEALVRQYLVTQTTGRLAADLPKGGAPVDAAESTHIAAELERTRRQRFRSVEIRRALLAPPLRRRTNFVVRVVVAGPDGPARPRYFWLFGTSSSSVGASSRLAWAVPL